MFSSVLFIVLGAALTVVGVRVATTRPRPASLGGGLLAPVGLLLLYLGVVRLLAPGAL